jgi:hypothetical protein
MRPIEYTVMLGALIGVGLVCTVLPAPAHACAVCVGLEDHGYFWGVLFLMSMPFAVGSLIGGWLWYNYRRPRSGPVIAVPTATVERQMPQPAVMSSASDRRN